MRNLNAMNRRGFLLKSALAAGASLAASFHSPKVWAAGSAARKAGKAIPVILATDIGDDIDDTWALGLLLRSPELDLKLAVTEYGKPQYRGKILAKFLQTAGRTDVPVGLGPDGEPHGEGGQAAWVKDYELNTYPGKVHADGVQALIDTIMLSRQPVTLICIGPMPTVAAALAREPRIAKRARFVGMDGSVRLGYDGSKTVSAEWNVKAAVKAAQAGLTAPWDITITPLDTCGLVTLDGERYQRLLRAKDPIPSTIIQNYRLWCQSNKNPAAADQRSSVLFDTVAVYLAFTHALCKMERLGIRVTDDGYTRIDNGAKRMTVATEWKSLDGYRDFLVNRLLGQA